MRKPYLNTHEYHIVNHSDFKHLDIAFYSTCEKILINENYRLLGDIEDIFHKNQTPDPRTFRRLMVSNDDSITAAFYHVKPKFPWSILIHLFGFGSTRIYEFITEFNDKMYLTSTIASKKSLPAHFDNIKKEYYPKNTSIFTTVRL